MCSLSLYIFTYRQRKKQSQHWEGRKKEHTECFGALYLLIYYFAFLQGYQKAILGKEERARKMLPILYLSLLKRKRYRA